MYYVYLPLELLFGLGQKYLAKNHQHAKYCFFQLYEVILNNNSAQKC